MFVLVASCSTRSKMTPNQLPLVDQTANEKSTHTLTPSSMHQLGNKQSVPSSLNMHLADVQK